MKYLINTYRNNLNGRLVDIGFESKRQRYEGGPWESINMPNILGDKNLTLVLVRMEEIPSQYDSRMEC